MTHWTFVKRTELGLAAAESQTGRIQHDSVVSVAAASVKNGRLGWMQVSDKLALRGNILRQGSNTGKHALLAKPLGRN